MDERSGEFKAVATAGRRVRSRLAGLTRQLLIGTGMVALVLGGFSVFAGPASAEVGYSKICKAYAPLAEPTRRYTPRPASSYDPTATLVNSVRLRDSAGAERTFRDPVGPIDSGYDTPWVGETVCLSVPHQVPQGQILITKVDGHGVGIFGYAYDPELAGPVTVRAYMGGESYGHWRFVADWKWTAAPNYPAEANDKGVLVLIDNVPSGTHDICLSVEDPTPLEDATGAAIWGKLGCVQVVVK